MFYRDIKIMYRQRCPEVLFRNEFVSRNPWDDPVGPQTTYFPDNPLPATIPIRKLVHITHPTEAGGIEKEGDSHFKFIPRMKYGKSYEPNQGGGYGETYEKKADGNYEEIQYTDSVFPGYLSWWGIDVRDSWHEGRSIVSWNERNGRYVPGYLATKPQSPYGSVAFSIELSDILKYYKRARKSDQGAEVCLKVGGTLRYRHEICYVVIVCLKDDELGDMPRRIAGHKFPQFVSNGLVDNKGIVIDRNMTPEFIATNIIKSARNDNGKPKRGQRYAWDNYSWEQLVFAFYFPTGGENLVCKGVTKTSYEHFDENCQKCKNTTPMD